jgi:hypothetical protein
VVTFPRDRGGPKLWLSREEAIAGGSEDLRKLDVTTCTSCGQHYFVHHVEDFEYTDAAPRGGRAEGESAHWPALDETHGGRRLILVDRIVGGEDEDAPGGDEAGDEAGEESGGENDEEGQAGPGHGLDTGSVLASHRAPRYASHLRDVQLRRPLALALREYVPGNFLYANGHRFYPRYFHLQAGAHGELGDAGAMAVHLSRLARVLLGKEQARAIKDDTRWFAGTQGDGSGDP